VAVMHRSPVQLIEGLYGTPHCLPLRLRPYDRQTSCYPRWSITELGPLPSEYCFENSQVELKLGFGGFEAGSGTEPKHAKQHFPLQFRGKVRSNNLLSAPEQFKITQAVKSLGSKHIG